MTIEDYGTCVANTISGDVDTVLGAIRRAGEDAWRAFITWYRGLSDADRALFLAVLAISSGIIVKLIEAAIGAAGAEIGAAIIILLGIAAWATIIDGLITCESRL